MYVSCFDVPACHLGCNGISPLLLPFFPTITIVTVVVSLLVEYQFATDNHTMPKFVAIGTVMIIMA